MLRRGALDCRDNDQSFYEMKSCNESASASNAVRARQSLDGHIDGTGATGVIFHCTLALFILWPNEMNSPHTHSQTNIADRDCTWLAQQSQRSPMSNNQTKATELLRLAATLYLQPPELRTNLIQHVIKSDFFPLLNHLGSEDGTIAQFFNETVYCRVNLNQETILRISYFITAVDHKEQKEQQGFQYLKTGEAACKAFFIEYDEAITPGDAATNLYEHICPTPPYPPGDPLDFDELCKSDKSGVLRVIQPSPN
jgi:hypothetical protein